MSERHASNVAVKIKYQCSWLALGVVYLITGRLLFLTKLLASKVSFQGRNSKEDNATYRLYYCILHIQIPGHLPTLNMAGAGVGCGHQGFLAKITYESKVFLF